MEMGGVYRVFFIHVRINAHKLRISKNMCMEWGLFNDRMIVVLV